MLKQLHILSINLKLFTDYKDLNIDKQIYSMVINWQSNLAIFFFRLVVYIIQIYACMFSVFNLKYLYIFRTDQSTDLFHSFDEIMI